VLINDISGILETYYNATGLPVYYIDRTNKLLFRFPGCVHYQDLLDFFDFGEVLELTKLLFSGNADRYTSLCHILYTRSLFIYTVTALNSDHDIAGAVISGPVPAYQPDENRIDELLLQNGLPLRRKPEMKTLLNILPSISSERLYHHSTLILLLFKSNVAKEDLQKPLIHNNWRLPKLFLNIPLNDNVDAILYKRSNLFLKAVRNLIISGDVKKTVEFLSNSIDILRDTTGNSGSALDLLRSRYTFLCAYSCICSVQGKVPYKYIVNILNQAIANMGLWKTSDEIVMGIITVIRDCTQAVSTNVKNHHSLHVNRALQYIRNYYTSRITLEVLADYVQINPVYLSSLIKKETNFSLADNINKIRVEESCSLLALSDKSINEIAFMVGYSYQNHYCRVFKRFTGMSPLEYRRILRQNITG
jgi:AraC-like DNA-binding protein